MNLGIIGLLVSLNDIMYLGGPKWQVRDMSVITHEVAKLKEAILDYPGFTYESFRREDYKRVNNIGIFASKNLRKYMFPNLNIPGVNGMMGPDEKGFLLVFYYEPRSTSVDSKVKHETLHILALDKEVDPVAMKTLLARAVQKNILQQQNIPT